MPAAVKPIVENVANYSFFQQRPLEGKREEGLEPGFRYRDNTSEIAKLIGRDANVSPIKIENLISGYTGSIGLALTQALNLAMPTEGTPEKATQRLSDAPIIGPLFQPNDATGLVADVYDRLQHIQQVKKTYDELLKEGRRAEAKDYLQRNSTELAQAATAGNAQQQLNKINQAMNAIRASSMTPDQKREKLDKLRELQIKLATTTREAFDKTTPQASRP
jgi:hypothetical protein